MQDSDLITRDQVLQQLHTWGYHVTERQLKSWVTYGILPRPMRKVPPGATDGVARAVYPVYMVEVVVDLLHRMAHGESRAALKQEAPTLIREREQAFMGQPPAEWQPFATPPGPPPPRVSRALMHAVWEYAAQIAEQRGHPITLARLQFDTGDGDQPIIILIGPPPPQRAEDTQVTTDRQEVLGTIY